MKIQYLGLREFTVFSGNNDFNFCRNINVFLGENSTGKTQILRGIYSILSVIETMKEDTNVNIKRSKITEMFNQVFGIEKIGSLSNFESKEDSVLMLKLDETKKDLLFHFNSQRKYIYTTTMKVADEIVNKTNVLYISVKEMLSNTVDYRAYYEERKLSNDYVYYDLAKKLLLPELKELSVFAKKVVEIIENEIGFKIIFENSKFYFKYLNKKIEIDLLAEGYKKLALILILLKNGSLNKNTILLWDEPEVNMNPKFMSLIFKILKILSENGVQVILATHSYFLCQEMDLYSLDDRLKNKIDIKFFSLYKEDKKIKCETNFICQELEKNKIYDQFESLFERGAEIE